MPFFEHDGLRFHYCEMGEGIPFVFQHGLGGNVAQPFGLVRPPRGFRMLAFDCRGHGQTDLGDAGQMTLAHFADDLLALMNHLVLVGAVVGGISMGAAVALNFALRFPSRTLGLVLSRPAWLDRPMAENAAIYGRIAHLIRTHGAKEGLARFRETHVYADMRLASPDCANSLVGQFESPRAEDAVARLERIPRDTPSRDRRDWAGIRVPVLVLANRLDPIHPFEYGETLAKGIPDAEFNEVTAKSISVDRHAEDVQAVVGTFLINRVLHVLPAHSGKRMCPC